jgi:FkbM family methyltransferase
MKMLIVRLFRLFGLDIRRSKPAPPSRDNLAGMCAHLADSGLQPRTVIDVGVASDTADLYSAFSSAKLLLIEPLAEFEPSLKKICTRFDAQYVLAAAGASSGSVTLNVHPDRFGSSILREVEGAGVDGTPRTVPLVTIDSLVSEKSLSGPFLLKVDVQGAELQVLAGATETLRHTEVVLLEVTLLSSLIGGPQLHDVVLWMKYAGFVAYDIGGLHYRPLDNALCQVDIAFVREDGPFRRSHAYATPGQRQAQFAASARMFQAGS